METNVKGTALIIEGGGMRASYTSGFINVLLENEIYFDYVVGISAGASCSVNYLSRDQRRVKESFVDLAKDPNFGGLRSFLRGDGFFHSQYIYETTPFPGGALPFDFAAFRENPAQLKIGAFLRDEARMEYFSKADMTTLEDLMKIVRASSTLPGLMPATQFQNRVYYDGGIGGGIGLDRARADGFDRFFVLLSREKGYVKAPLKHPGLIRTLYKGNPELGEAFINRGPEYNRQKAELVELERQGKAFLVYPDQMMVSRGETKLWKLEESYRAGYQQGKRQIQCWKDFLFE